jgi:hypothetical protein
MVDFPITITVPGNVTFSKIRLRTKRDVPVFNEELSRREIVLSDFEKCIFVKDLEDNLLLFLPIHNDRIDHYSTWDSKTIVDYIEGNSFTVLHGGYF